MGLIVRETPGVECAGLGATLTPSSSLSTHWPCLISGHPERADIRTTWSEELPPIFNEQPVYKNNPSLTQTNARAHKDQNGLLFFYQSFRIEETASVSYTQIQSMKTWPFLFLSLIQKC